MLSIANTKDLFYMRIFGNNQLDNDHGCCGLLSFIKLVRHWSDSDLIATYSVTQASASD